MNKKTNDLIPEALIAIDSSGMAENGVVDKEYKGYISSMGAGIIQSGLIATIVFYSNESSGVNSKRIKLLKAIRILIAPQEENDLLNYIILKVKPVNKNDFEISSLNPSGINKLEEEISNALIVLKLVLRTFKKREQ